MPVNDEMRLQYSSYIASTYESAKQRMYVLYGCLLYVYHQEQLDRNHCDTRRCLGLAVVDPVGRFYSGEIATQKPTTTRCPQ